MALFVIFLVVAIAIILIAGYTIVLEALEAREGRLRGRRRSVEAEWRIQQIGSNARAQMWEEATRHRENGGG